MANHTIGPISAVRVFVYDLVLAKRFYQDRLGLVLSIETADCLIFKTGDAQLILEPVARTDEVHKSYVGRFTGISFDVKNIEAVHGELVGKGVSFESAPTKQDWGGILAHFKDADDNILTLVEHE